MGFYITEDAHGRRKFFETVCGYVPDGISDHQILNALAEELRTDFAASGVVRFAIGFLVSRITKLHRVDPPTEDVMLTTSGVILEMHDSDGTHLRRFRKIVGRPGEVPVLLAMSELNSTDDGIYAGVLNTVLKPRNVAAE